jgi:DNA-binding CsgD family transcriptional regulator
VRPVDAEAIAVSATKRAAATGQAAVECEALEVLGRLLRERSADESIACLERAAALAEQHGLTNSHLRARHELALLRAYVDGDAGLLGETRDLAARQGALVTVAVMDLTLAELALAQFDRVGCLEAARRCVDASRRYRLATLPVAHLWLAGGHALADQEAEMEAAAARALEPDPDDPRILGDLWGRVRAVRSAVRTDHDRLRRDLDTMMDFARVAPTTTSLFPNRILWALLHTIDDDDHGAAARAELAAATHLTAWPLFEAASELIAAVAQGREGDGPAATARFAAATERMRPYGVGIALVHYLRLHAAEAAVRDGWGDPATWAREAEAFFSARGYDRIARWSRSLLAKAGAPVPRRGRGDSVVPSELRALGITSRELDVLKLIAAGLSNRRIAERLVLSPKTVEHHVTSLFDRTGIRNRAALGDFARANRVGDGP